MKIILITILMFLLLSCSSENILTASVPTRTPIQNSNPANCPQWKSGDTIKITKNTLIPKGCAYDKVSFVLATSNITFNCNNAELNGLGKTTRNALYQSYTKKEAPRNTAFSIIGSEDNLLQNITVKNCTIRFYINGFNIAFNLKKKTHHILKLAQNTEQLENQLRKKSPKNIRIENNKIIDSHKSAIFLQRYVTDLVANNNTISGAGDIGIYLESGTQRNTISNSVFTKNGHATYSLKKRMRKIRFRKREAIAIDSSAYNIIRGNTFIDNAGGAIFMYKNCYERYKEEQQLPRNQGSNFNLIKNNLFKNENKGIWVASRQSRELSGFQCGDKVALITANGERYYEDFAKNNKIINNTFKNTKNAIIIEDDNNLIAGNIFKNTQVKDLIIGTLGYTKHKVKGIIVKNNIFSGSNRIWLRYHPINTLFSGNTPSK